MLCLRGNRIKWVVTRYSIYYVFNCLTTFLSWDRLRLVMAWNPLISPLFGIPGHAYPWGYSALLPLSPHHPTQCFLNNLRCRRQCQCHDRTMKFSPPYLPSHFTQQTFPPCFTPSKSAFIIRSQGQLPSNFHPRFVAHRINYPGMGKYCSVGFHLNALPCVFE